MFSDISALYIEFSAERPSATKMLQPDAAELILILNIFSDAAGQSPRGWMGWAGRGPSTV